MRTRDYFKLAASEGFSENMTFEGTKVKSHMKISRTLNPG